MSTRPIAIVLVTLLMAGCSAAVYENEIKSFKSSTDTAAQAVVAFAAGADDTAARNALRRTIRERGVAVVTLSPDCGKAAEKSCRVLINGQEMERQKDATTVEVVSMMKLLTDYAGSLDAVASSKDIAEATTSIGGLAKDVGSLIGKLPLPGAGQKGVEAAVGPITGVVTWLAGNYLNYKRYVALREATGLVQPALAGGKARLNQLAVAVQADYAQQRLVEFDVVSKAVKPDGKADEVPAIMALQNSGNEVAAIVNAKPDKMFDALVDAHGALTDALADPTRQAETLIKAIQSFKKAVDDMAAVLAK